MSSFLGGELFDLVRVPSLGSAPELLEPKDLRMEILSEAKAIINAYKC
jgi:hypothetical protein